MMVSYKQVKHFSVHATDSDIGGIRDVLFDDQSFVVRYLVADTNTWLPLSRKVVISPISVAKVDHENQKVEVAMSAQTLKDSPSIEEHKPVSRDYEETLFRYFGYGYYWIGPGAWGDYSHPTDLAAPEFASVDEDNKHKTKENHLRACGEINGYEVAASDDNVGHICDFVFDTQGWRIQLLVVDTNNWLPGGKKLALVPSDVTHIDWSSHNVSVALSHDNLLSRPEVDMDKLGDEVYVKEVIAEVNAIKA